MIVTMESAVFMEKNYLNTCQSIVNTADLTLKQMFDVSARLVSEQDEISGLETIGWENHSWKYLSLIGDERIINLQRTKVYVFPDSVLFLGKIFENPESNDAWEQRSEWIKILSNITETLTESTVSRWNSSGIFSKDSILCSSVKKSKVYSKKWEIYQKKSQEEFYLCRCSTTFPVERKTMRKNVWHTLESYPCMQGSLDKDNGHSLVLVYPITEDILQGIWDEIAERMLLEFAESGCPIFRATTPLSRGHFKSKGGGKLSIHYCADLDTVRTVFRTIISANQLSLYGAVGEMCEEIGNPSRENGETRCDGTIKFFTRAERDQNRSTFGL